ncbi:hypothetical protein [Agromyces larvae]|uniref:Uncharacterized protein n=1 Tax=Agromyces larvae TaxID=2929802 RepID=A0ABY4BZ75_9MICO|nr:hypothetical protein [Agromyces larvae]UOE44517.1 hypothetical protein MTO99_01610 [Agromyces larvae]
MSIILLFLITGVVAWAIVGAALSFAHDGYGWRGIPDRLHDADVRGIAEAR